MALDFNFGNPNEAMTMSLRGLKDYYNAIDDPKRKALELAKGYNNTLSSSSSLQNTSNKMGAKTGRAGAMGSNAGYRGNNFGQVEGDETKQLINMQQKKDAVSARLKGLAMGQKLAGQQSGMALQDANYYQNQNEVQAGKLLEDQRYLQTLQDLATREEEQRRMLDINDEYTPSGWERFGAAAAGGAGGLGGYALGNYLSQPSTQEPDWLDDEYWNLDW